MKNKKDTITLDDLLNRVNSDTKKLISELEAESDVERIETIDSIVNDIKGQKKQTELHKKKFANEIKSGLGNKIKENPNDIKIYVKPWNVKLKEWIKSIFTRF